MVRLLSCILSISAMCIGSLYSQTCFGLLQNQLSKIKISKSKSDLLNQMIESSFYKVQTKITYKETDANVLSFSGNLVSHTGEVKDGNITFNLLHPEGKDFQYDIVIKNGKFFEEFFTEQKFLPGIYLWKANITLGNGSFTNELFFVMEIKGNRKSVIKDVHVKKDDVVNPLEYISRLHANLKEHIVKSLEKVVPMQYGVMAPEEKFINSFKKLELQTKGLYYFIYILHKLIELTNETAYLVQLINKDRKAGIHLRKHIHTAYMEFWGLLKNLSQYRNKELWEEIDNTMPIRLSFLKNYYRRAYESFKKINVDTEYIGKTFEISTTTVESLSRIMW